MNTGHAAEREVDTRQRILQAALSAFGHNDYDSVSIRHIVESAGVNIAAVSYHFGGKKALYLEVAAYLADHLHSGVKQELARIDTALPGAGPESCRRMASELISRFVESLLTGPSSEDIPGFMFREQNHPTEAFDVLYEKLMKPMHETLVGLVARVRGLPRDADEVLMLAHALLGPAVAFRAARTTLLRHLSHRSYKAADLALIKNLAFALTAASLDCKLQQNDSGVSA